MRRIVAITAAAVGMMALAVFAGSAIGARHSAAQARWSGVWATAHHQPTGNRWDGPNWSVVGFVDQSIRQVVRVSAGGAGVRIRLSNRFGGGPLRVAGATVGKTSAGASVWPGTLRALTFDRSPSAMIPAETEAASDATLLRVAPLESLTVTLYLAAPSGPATFHQGGFTTTYRAAGDHRFDPDAAAFGGETSNAWYYLTGVDVASRFPATVVAFGDSITDGFESAPNTNNRYPDQLAERLVATGRPLGVANAGISGNKLLADSTCYGENGVTRFRRDALGQPGVRTVIVLIGLNDIGAGGLADLGCGRSPVLTPEEIIAGYRAIIRAAHARGVRVIGATLTPIKYSVYDDPSHESVRDSVNAWIRTSGEYDGVVDLDAVLADPADPDALLPAYACADWLHPNDAGLTAIAAATNLTRL